MVLSYLHHYNLILSIEEIKIKINIKYVSFNFIPKNINDFNKFSFKAFFWVQNNISEVTVRLRNPLPFELTVSDMRLLTNGIVFKSLPQTVVLQPQVPTNVTLHGTPLEVGQLEIQGYSTHTLGVKSNCRMKHMKDRKFPQNFLVDVIPALPIITVKTSLPQTATFSTMSGAESVVTTASLTLYNGESSTCIITITNDSDIPVEHLEVNITSNIEQETQKKIFQIKEDLQVNLIIVKIHNKNLYIFFFSHLSLSYP